MHYVEVRVQKPSGVWYTTAFYECLGCSVMFRDPVVFARTRAGAQQGQPMDGTRLWITPSSIKEADFAPRQFTEGENILPKLGRGEIAEQRACSRPLRPTRSLSARSRRKSRDLGSCDSCSRDRPRKRGSCGPTSGHLKALSSYQASSANAQCERTQAENTRCLSAAGHSIYPAQAASASPFQSLAGSSISLPPSASNSVARS